MPKTFQPVGGFIQEPLLEQDWIFGGKERPDINETGDWRKYKPTPEKQATRAFDPFSCVSSSLTNALEELLSHLIEKDSSVKDILVKLDAIDENGLPNFSERFLAVMSGTVPGRGNSQRAVFECLRKHGIVGENVWPTQQNMTQSQYFASIPQEVRDKAKEFLKYFEFEYEAIVDGNVSLKKATKKGPLVTVVGGYYFGDEAGILLYRNDGPINYNHQVNYIHQEQDVEELGEKIPVIHHVFDSYDPFDKRFWEKYPFAWSKIIYLKKKRNMKYKISGKPAIFLLDPVGKQLVPYGSGKVYKTIEGTVDYQDIIEVANLEKLLEIAPLADWMITSSDWDNESYLNS